MWLKWNRCSYFYKFFLNFFLKSLLLYWSNIIRDQWNIKPLQSTQPKKWSFLEQKHMMMLSSKLSVVYLFKRAVKCNLCVIAPFILESKLVSSWLCYWKGWNYRWLFLIYSSCLNDLFASPYRTGSITWRRKKTQHTLHCFKWLAVKSSPRWHDRLTGHPHFMD